MRLVRGALRLALVTIAGVAASLVLAVPANADDQPVKAISDGEANCTDSGDIAVPWHIAAAFAVTIDSVRSDPAGTLLVDGDPPWDNSVTIWQLVPDGTTTSGLSFTWTEKAHPENSGTGTGTTTQPFPACGDPQAPSGSSAPEATAAFVSRCGRLVDVTIHNGFAKPFHFLVNGVPIVVNADSSIVVENVAPLPDGRVEVHLDAPFSGLLADYTWIDPGGCPAPGLPQTGSSVGGVIGLGGGLLVVGALLVVLSIIVRRRRVTI